MYLLVVLDYHKARIFGYDFKTLGALREAILWGKGPLPLNPSVISPNPLFFTHLPAPLLPPNLKLGRSSKDSLDW